MATRGRGASRWLAILAGTAVEIIATRDGAEVTEQARKAVNDGLDRVLVAGGDGTLHHAIQALTGSACALAIIPLGAGNDLARALGLDLDPAASLRIALRGAPRRIDLGRIGGRFFAGVAGIGFDGEVNRYVSRVRPALRSRWIYPWAVLRTLSRFVPPRVRIEYEAGVYEDRVMMAAVANSSYFGGGMRIAPSARLDDGQLELVAIRAISKTRLLTLFPKVYSGAHVGHPAVTTLPLRSVRLRADRRIAVHADGEFLLPLSPGGSTIEIAPQALSVITDRDVS